MGEISVNDLIKAFENQVINAHVASLHDVDSDRKVYAVLLPDDHEEGEPCRDNIMSFDKDTGKFVWEYIPKLDIRKIFNNTIWEK